MPALTPYIGLSHARLLALMNADNNTSYQEGVDLTFGPPIAKAGTGGRNTQVTITPVDPTKYAGPQDLHYTRLGIDAIGRLPTGSVDPVPIVSLPFTIHGVLGQINAALGLNLLPEEVEDTQYTDIQDTYTLTLIGATSLAWLDSSYNFVAEINGVLPLSAVITVTDLNGLDYVRPPTP